MATLYEFISDNKKTILDRTRRVLHAREPDRSEVEVSAVLDPILDEILATLSGVEAVPHPMRGPARAGHGRRGDIKFMLARYGALCDAITGAAAEHGLSFAAAEIRCLNRCVTAGVGASITAYSDQSRWEAERESGRRAAVLAHELRNALATATTAFAVLHDDDPGNRTAAVLQRSLERMSDLVEHTLIELRLRSGTPQQRRRLGIAELLRDIQAASVSKRDVRVRVLADESLEVEADACLVTSAVTNLVHNALKFTRRGGLVVVRAVASGSQVLIEVEDECGGLSPGGAESLLTPQPYTSRSRTGTGLGLAIAREAAEKSGGTIAARNVPGQGCIFALAFPRVLEHTLDDAASG